MIISTKQADACASLDPEAQAAFVEHQSSFIGVWLTRQDAHTHTGRDFTPELQAGPGCLQSAPRFCYVSPLPPLATPDPGAKPCPCAWCQPERDTDSRLPGKQEASASPPLQHWHTPSSLGLHFSFVRWSQCLGEKGGF